MSSSPFLTDTFTDTAGVALDAHTGELNATWTRSSVPGNTTAAQIAAGGSVRPSTASGISVYTASAAPSVADYDVVATLTVKSLRTNDYAGVIGRVVVGSAANYYGATYQHGTGYYLFKQVNNNYTQLGTADAVTAVDGDVITLQFRSTTLNLLVNGVLVASVTDTSFSAAGSVGTFLYAASAPSDTAGVQLTAIGASSTSFSAGSLAITAGVPASGALDIAAATAPSAGTAPYTTRLDRSFDGGATWHPLDNAGALPFIDAGLPRATAVTYRAVVLDSASTVAVSASATGTTAAAGGTPAALVVCGIDSITHGYGASTDQTANSVVGLITGSNYPARLTGLLGDGWAVQNVGIDGQDLPTALAANREAAFFSTSTYPAGQVLVLFGGINDLRNGVTAAAAYASLKSYVTARKAAGWRVVVCTLHDVLDPASSFTTAAKDAFNASIRSGWQYDLHADALADVGVDNRIGADGAASRAGYADFYTTLDVPKHEHLNDRGYEILAGIVAPAVAAAVTNVPFVDPGPANVRAGVSFGDAEVGTYAGGGTGSGVLGGFAGQSGFFGF